MTIYNIICIQGEYKNLTGGGAVAAYPLRSAVTRH